MKDSCGEDSEEVRSNVEKSYIPQENARHQKQTICRDRDLKATAGSAPRLDLENVALERSEESKEMPPDGGRGGSRIRYDKLGPLAEESSKSRVENAACFYPAAQSIG